VSNETVEALVNPEVVKWAITRRNLSLEKVASKIRVDSNELEDWRRGRSRPTFNQAQDLARKLNIPFGYFFLLKPPAENLPLPDLRTLNNATPRQTSPNLLSVVYDAFRKQEWYHDFLEEENTPRVPFIGKFSENDKPEIIAADIIKTLGIDDDLRQSCDTWEQFLKEIIRRVEKSHVLAIRAGFVGNDPSRKLDINEFQGFAISDNLAPLIFINEGDYKSAQIFTAIHELAHLWINRSGVSKIDYRSKKQSHTIDQLCDRIAAEVLVPGDDFRIRWNNFYGIERNLKKLASHYRVSQFVILRRAYDFDWIDIQQYQKYYDLLLERITPKKSGGGNYYKVVLSRNSPTLTKTLIAAVGEGRILPTEVSRLLNIRVSKLSALEAFVVFGEASHA